MDWQPIATAPRDAEIVDLWTHDHQRFVSAWWSPSGKRWHYGDGVFDDDYFTHWLRLISPSGEPFGRLD